jgi:hypothetical protein
MGTFRPRTTKTQCQNVFLFGTGCTMNDFVKIDNDICAFLILHSSFSIFFHKLNVLEIIETTEFKRQLHKELTHSSI